MKLKLQHAQFIANRITTDLSKSNMVKIIAPLPNITKLIEEIIREDIKEEISIEAKVRELLEEYQDEIDDNDMNEKQLFAMAKKQVARDRGFLLSHDERYSNLAHVILDEIFEESFIEFKVAENAVKNCILESINSYFKTHEKAYDNAMDKIRNYKKKLIAGSDEYELIFAKLYEEEIRKLG